MNYPLTTNQELTMVASDEFNRKQSYKLIITGLPIVQLTSGQAIGDNKVNAGFSLVDPDYLTHGGTLEVSSSITSSKG